MFDESENISENISSKLNLEENQTNELYKDIINDNNDEYNLSVDLANLKPYYQHGRKHKCTIIFIHGFSSNHESHIKVFSKFKKNGYPYYSFNLPGHGDNLTVAETEMRVINYTKLVVNFIIKNNLKNIILIGHSMGGGIAVLTNALIGNKIKALILEDPLNKEAFSFKMSRLKKVFFEKDELTGKRMGLIRWLKEIYKKRTEYKTLFKDLYSSQTTKDIDWAYSQIKDKPTLLLFGKHDMVIPPKDSIEYIDSVATNLKVCIFEKSQHSPHREEPELYFEQIIDFINNIYKKKIK